MKPGAWTAPSVSFDEDDIRGGIQVSTRHSRRENFNAVRGVFAGIETEWEFTDYPLVRDSTPATSIQSGLSYTILSVGSTDFTAIGASSNTVGVTFVATGVGVGTGAVDAYLGSDNGLPNVMDLPLKFTTTSKSAQRLARLVLNRNREQLTISVNLNMRGFLIGVGDVIQMSNTRFGWSNKTFEVVAWNFGIADDLSLYTSVTLRELTESVFATVNGAVLELNNTTLPSPFRSTAPVTLTLSSSVGFAADGSYVTQIVASWSASSDSFVNQYEIQWKKSTDATYFSALVEDLSYAIPSTLNDVQYNVRVRAINLYGYRGAFTSQSITVGKDLTPPAPPTSLSAVGNFGYIALSWTNPADSDFSYVQVFEGSTDVFASSTVIATAFGSEFLRGNLSPGVAKYFWLKAVDTSGNISSTAGPVAATTQYIDNGDFVNGVVNLFLDQSLGPIPSGNTFPLSPSNGDKFYLTTDGQLYEYVAASTRWELIVQPGSLVASDAIVANTITGGLLAASGIITSSAQINNAVIQNANIGNLQVGRIKIATGAVTTFDFVQKSVTFSGLTTYGVDTLIDTISVTVSADSNLVPERYIVRPRVDGYIPIVYSLSAGEFGAYYRIRIKRNRGGTITELSTYIEPVWQFVTDGARMTQVFYAGTRPQVVVQITSAGTYQPSDILIFEYYYHRFRSGSVNAAIQITGITLELEEYFR
jgi:hypothetical protein